MSGKKKLPDAAFAEAAAEKQARYAQARREHRERLGLAHGVGNRND
jgi:hypothetical protein